jgi:hypothetical protein
MADNGGMLRLCVSHADGGGGEAGEELGAPQGRLTLTSGVPVLTSDVTGAGTIYYTPYIGDFCPLFDGSSTWTMTQFTELSQALSDSAKSPAAAAAHECYDLFVWDDGGTKRCTRGPAWKFAQTFTVTIASPAVFSATAHGLVEGNTVRFTTTGALPTGLTAGTVYFVIAAGLTANAFEVSATLGGAAINTSGTQSGTHTCTDSNTRRGSGAGTTELTRTASGREVNTNAITNGPAAARGTYIGSIRTDGNAQCNMMFKPAAAAGGAGNRLDVWNAYNQIKTTSINRDSSASWTYSTDAWRLKNNSAGNVLQCIIGLPSSDIEAVASMTAQHAQAGAAAIAFGLNSSVAVADGCSPTLVPTQVGAKFGSGTCVFSMRAGAGHQILYPLERGSATTTTWENDVGTYNTPVAAQIVVWG